MSRARIAGASFAVVAVLLTGCTGGSGSGAPTTTVTATTTPSAPSTSATTTSTGPPATASSAASSSGGGSGDPTRPGLCTPSVSTFALTNGEGAAGTQYFTVVVTNASASPCTTVGYPGVALLDGTGATLLDAGRDAAGTPANSLTLQPGEHASAVIGAADMGANGAGCPTSPAFLFTLPNNTDSTRLVHDTPACAVTVWPLVKGTG